MDEKENIQPYAISDQGSDGSPAEKPAIILIIFESI